MSLLRKNMKAIEKLNNKIDFKNSAHRYKGTTANINFNDNIDATAIFDELNSIRIKLADQEKKSNDI